MSIQLFQPIKDRFLKLANEETFMKEASFALQHIGKNAQLQKATTESKIEAVLNVAQTGLSLNPTLKLAYLVPRWSKAGTVCHLEPSYQGLVKLLTDTGSVLSVSSHLVYANDEFSLSLGSEPKVEHKPALKDKGEVTHVYAIAKLPTGNMVEVMDVEEVNEIRDISESWKAYKSGKLKACVWSEHWGEMARKTVIRRLVKYLPKTDRFEKVAQAVKLDEGDYKIGVGRQDYLQGLINNSTFDEDRKVLMESSLSDLSRYDAERLEADLLANQLDPIDSGHNYSQTDIKRKL